MGHLKEFKNNWLNFSGTVGRADFWWTQLWMIVLLVVSVAPLTLLAMASKELMVLVAMVFFILFIIASFSLQTRRIRDAGYSPWFMLGHITGVTTIVPWIMCFLPTGHNKIDPLG